MTHCLFASGRRLAQDQTTPPCPVLCGMSTVTGGCDQRGGSQGTDARDCQKPTYGFIFARGVEHSRAGGWGKDSRRLP